MLLLLKNKNKTLNSLTRFLNNNNNKIIIINNNNNIS